MSAKNFHAFICVYAKTRLDPEGLFKGGTESGDLNRATQVANGGEYERGVGGGQGDLPRFLF